MKRQGAFGAILVGGGPAGLAVLLSAHRDGRLRELLQHGLLIVEQGDAIGAGQIGSYAINSDSTGATFVDPLRCGTESLLHNVLQSPVAQRIAAAGAGAVPLSDVGELMREIGTAISGIVAGFPRSSIRTRHTAHSAQRGADGLWQLQATDALGRRHLFKAAQLILATGASQPQARLQQEWVAGVNVVSRWSDRLLQSGDVLRQGGMAAVAERLRGKVNPRIAILGGSTSAVAVAHALLHRCPEVSFRAGGVCIVHRRALRLYYTSVEEARADGYNDFGPDDLCPVTQRVFRFAGLRLDSRELLMQVLGVGGRAPEPRLHLHALGAEDSEAVARIDSADLVISAMGYRPNGLSLLDANSRAIKLLAHSGPSAPMVDAECRVLDASGLPVPGVYGIGLAAGFVPSGRFGGEPSFSGQANGLWLWQNGVGSVIANSILEHGSRPMLQHRADRRGTRALFRQVAATFKATHLATQGMKP